MPRPISAGIVVSGFFNEALGIGRAGQLVAKALEDTGFTVWREDLRPFDRGLLTRAPHPFAEGRKADAWLIEANPPEARIALYSHDYAVWKNLYRIAFWHWESDLAPADWVRMAPWFHEIWVSSAFVLEALSAAMRKAGLADQIDKLRLHPLPVEVPQAAQKSLKDTGHVRVITLFDPRSHFERKNPMAVIAAWCLLLPEPDGKARLIIKALDQAADHPLFAPLKSMAGGRDDIVFHCETLSNTATAQLIGDCDILISLHRAEGFGLTLAEAMAMGVSVIGTGWSGNLQFMTPENSVLVPYHLVPAAKRYNGPQAQWAEPDIAAAVAGLKRLIDDPALRQRLSGRAYSDIAAARAVWDDERRFLPPAG